MIFTLKKIKLIAIGSSIFFCINSCLKETVVSNLTHGPGPEFPYVKDDPEEVPQDKPSEGPEKTKDKPSKGPEKPQDKPSKGPEKPQDKPSKGPEGSQDKPSEGPKGPKGEPSCERGKEYDVNLFISDVKEKIIIDTDQYLQVEYFPIGPEFPKGDHKAVIHNAGDVAWFIGGGTLNGACANFANSNKYGLYEVVNEHKIKKQNLDFSYVLSKEELKTLEDDKKIQTQYCDLFLSSEDKLGCKLLLLSNASIAKDRNNYNFMLYQVGPNNFDVRGKDTFFTDLTKSNESYYRVIEKNKELLKGRTIYYSGVSNCGYASKLKVQLDNNEYTAVENIINAHSLKVFIGKNTDLGIKIVLNRETSIAYNFIKDKSDVEISLLLKSAK